MIIALPYIIKKQLKQESYEYYIAENLRLIGENTARQSNGHYISAKWTELAKMKKKDERTGDEIASDVINRLGLTFTKDKQD